MALLGNTFALNKKHKMKKKITLLTLVLSVFSYAQKKSDSLATEKIAIGKLVKYVTAYYDKERESDFKNIPKME